MIPEAHIAEQVVGGSHRARCEVPEREEQRFEERTVTVDSR